MELQEFCEKLKNELKLEDCPFYNKETKQLEFKYQATVDRLFIYPRPLPKFFGNTAFVIPERYQHHHRDEFGIILSKGPGYISKSGKKVFTDEVQIGDIVFYDKTVPAKLDVEGLDEKEYEIKLVGILDVKGVIR